MATLAACFETDPRARALSAARTATERTLAVVLVNEGQESLARAWAGRDGVRLEPAGDLPRLCRLIGECEERIAAFVVSPAVDDDYRHKRQVKKLRELASAEGALLIWDEAAERIPAPGSRSAFYAVRPDLSLTETGGLR